MGHKVTAISFRLGHGTEWINQWGTNRRTYADNVKDYINIEKIIIENLDKNLYANLSYKKVMNTDVITIHTHRSSLVAEKIEGLREKVKKKLGKDIEIRMQNIDIPEANPVLIARKVADLMEKRKPIKPVMRSIFSESSRYLKGITLIIKGRIGVKEIASVKKKSKGKMPLMTIRSPISSHVEHVITKSGVCSVRVYVCAGKNRKEEK